jgi:hypothetical protein
VHNVPGASPRLGDFTATPRMITTGILAMAIGSVSAWVAKGLLLLIAFFTNVFFFQRISTAAVSPADNTLGLWILVVPVIGALIIGIMARYGSERIRGHGIPEAIEAHPDQRQPRRTSRRRAEAGVSRDLDWIGRSIRRRRPDHHDRRRDRIAHRAVLPPHERRA